MLPTHNQLQKMSGAPRSKAITIRFSDWLASGSLPAKMVGYVLGALIGLGFPSSLPLILWFLFFALARRGTPPQDTGGVVPRQLD